MKRESRNITDNPERQSEKNSWINPEYDKLVTADDSLLFDKIGEYLKGMLDMDEVRNDPSLPATDKAVKKMIKDYRDNSEKRTDNEEFIKGIFSNSDHDDKIVDEIKKIKLEIDEKEINGLTAEWVKEWHEKRQKCNSKNHKTKELQGFITSSLESEESEPEIILSINKPEVFKKSSLIRYFSFSAAAIIGALILIKTVFPSSAPEKIYSFYYEPFQAVSTITRDMPPGDIPQFQSSVESYKAGDYQSAAMGFSNLIQRDTSDITSRFYMGITEMARGNYEQAVIQLGGIKDRPGDYSKETGWYLGLAYLKTGKTEKATVCFTQLQSSAFFGEPSKKILRRLK